MSSKKTKTTSKPQGSAPSKSSTTEVVISIKNVSKLFHKQNQRTFKELIPAIFGGQSIVETFWALKNVNIEVKKGEVLGITGPNGAGKSTLLKLVARVTKPTKGKIITHGRIAPLIELGAGFHHELTGRENVYLNGIILGMSRAEVKAKFKEIVDFANIWEFIDQPIKRYSSGMFLRLAFAVAVHTDPDILLVDEILAVGDQKFRNKCFRRIEEMIAKGTTVLFVSHDQNMIDRICDRQIEFKKNPKANTI